MLKREDLKVGETYLNDGKKCTILFIGKYRVFFSSDDYEWSMAVAAALAIWEKLLIKGSFWVNVYPDSCNRYDTKEQANRFAGRGRIACIEVKYTEGEGL